MSQRPVKASYKVKSLVQKEKRDRTIVYVRKSYLLIYIITYPLNWILLFASIASLSVFTLLAPGFLYVVLFQTWYLATRSKKLVFEANGLRYKGKRYAWKDFHGFRVATKPFHFFFGFVKPRLAFEYGTKEKPFQTIADADQLGPLITCLNQLAADYASQNPEVRAAHGADKADTTAPG